MKTVPGSFSPNGALMATSMFTRKSIIILISIVVIVITIVERDTGKYHEFIAKYYYECEAYITSLF